MQFLRLCQVLQRAALLQEKIEEVLTLPDRRVIFRVHTKLSFSRHRRDVEAWKSDSQHMPEVVEVLETTLDIYLSKTITTSNWVSMVLSQTTLDKDRFTDSKLNLTIVSCDVD